MYLIIGIFLIENQQGAKYEMKWVLRDHRQDEHDFILGFCVMKYMK